MRAFALARLIVLSILTLFSVIELCLGAAIVANPNVSINVNTSIGSLNVLNGPSMSSAGSGLAVATSLITLLIVVPGFAFRLFKTEQWTKFLSLVWIELCWASVLDILWLATGAAETTFSLSTGVDATQSETGLSVQCTGCNKAKALKAFAWLSWLILFGYFVALLACFLVSIKRGLGSYSSMEIDDILAPQVEIAPPPSMAQADVEKMPPS